MGPQFARTGLAQIKSSDWQALLRKTRRCRPAILLNCGGSQIARDRNSGSVALTLLVAVRPLSGLHQAAITKMSNSLFTKRTSSLTCGLHVRQCPRRIIRITSNPFIVAAAVFIV